MARLDDQLRGKKGWERGVLFFFFLSFFSGAAVEYAGEGKDY